MYNDILYFNFCLLGLIVLSFFYFLFMVVPSWYNKYLAPPFNKEILLLFILLLILKPDQVVRLITSPYKEYSDDI